MRVTILGSGGAGGVPTIANGWGRCDPAEPRNRRTRPSILIEADDGRRVLVDTSPDLREQFLREGVRTVDAVIYTHGHADHVHGIDDLREVNRTLQGPLDCHATPDVLKDLHSRFGYVFLGVPEGQPVFRPWLRPRPIHGPFEAAGLAVVPFEQDHGWTTSLGLRFGAMAYSTDVVELDERAFAALDGVEVWIVGCLTNHPHTTHAHVDKVLGWVERLRPRLTVLTHMGPGLDYRTLADRLPTAIVPGYDGLVVDL